MSLSQSRKSTISSPLLKHRLRVSQTKVKKDISKTKQSSSRSSKSSISRTMSISKYFTNIKTQREDNNKLPADSKLSGGSPEQNTTKSIPFSDSVSDDDFQSPLILRKRNNLVWKLNNCPKPKSKLKNSHTKTRRHKNPTIEIIKENFQIHGENPEHLQMAIALSKSTYEAECGQKVEETPDVGIILQNLKPTNLERFGFKAAKAILPVENRRLHETSSEPSKKVKNRIKYITPILTLRSSEDREELIVSKMSCILGLSKRHVEKHTAEATIVSVKLKEFLPKDRRLFQLDNIYETNYFYTSNLDLPKGSSRCGSLLKNWSSIQGRDMSPERSTNTTEQDEKSCTSTTQLVFEAPIAKLWNLSAKDSRLSISSPCRSISPDLFGSDDEMSQFAESDDEYVDKSPSKGRNNEETSQATVSGDKNGDILSHSASSKSLTRSARFYCLEEFEDQNSGNIHIKNTESSKSPHHEVSCILNTPSQTSFQKMHSLDIEKSPELIEILDNSLSDHFENMNANSSQLHPDITQETNFGLNDQKHSFDDLGNHLNNEEHDYLRNFQLNADVSQENTKNRLSQSQGHLNADIVESKRFHIEDDSRHLDCQPEETIPCIEILDDSLLNILQPDDMTVSNIGPKEEIFKNCSIENTPKKGNRVAISTLSRMSRGYNSTDLNITDYVNNLLDKESCSFNDRTKPAGEEEMSNSQSSETSIIVDDELNYSSYFATPGRLRMAAKKNCVIDFEAEKSTPTQVPNVNPKMATSTKQPLSTPGSYSVRTENVTPMPDYREMTTPLINKELQKFGVKPLKRSRGAKLLEYIYESTHPLLCGAGDLESTDSEDDNRIIKWQKRSHEVNRMVEANDNLPIQSVQIVGDLIMEKEKAEELIFERRRSTKIPSCQVPLQIIWHNFLSCKPQIRENILLYEPLQLESLHLMLKEQGFKFHVKDLLTFLDKKCITVRTAQKQGKRHR